MSQQELAEQLELLMEESIAENFSLYYDKFEEALKSYRSSNGKGKFAYELFWRLWIQNNNDDYKNEVLEEMMSRMHGYCCPKLDIKFNDLKDFSTFDRESGKFIEEK